MPRTTPPLWVRWIGQDCIASCNQLGQLVDNLEIVTIAEQNPRATIEYLRGIRRHVVEIRDDMHKLQKATSFEELAQWLVQDQDLQVYIQTILLPRQGENPR